MTGIIAGKLTSKSMNQNKLFTNDNSINISETDMFQYQFFQNPPTSKN